MNTDHHQQAVFSHSLALTLFISAFQTAKQMANSYRLIADNTDLDLDKKLLELGSKGKVGVCFEGHSH